MIINTTTTKVSEEIDNDEIVTINAGGKLFQILRSTLCLPPDDTAFTKLFRKKTTTNNNSFEATHNILPSRFDANGNMFLDHDPELIEKILNFLRAKRIEDPFDPIVEPPFVSPHKTREFRRILNHFDLTAFFYYPSTMTAEPAAAIATSNY